MRLKHVLGIVAIAVLWGVACSDDDNNQTTPDSGIGQGDAAVDGGTADTKPTPAPDADLSNAPVIEAIIPADGFANGGTLGHIPVIMTGKNFAQGARVFIDGGAAPDGIIMEVSVASPVTVSFDMPPQPYDPTKPYNADVSIQVNGMMSNTVKFQYTISEPMDAAFKGSVLTALTNAYAEFNSKPIEAKVFAEGITDTTTGASTKLKVDIGFGPDGSDPSKDAGWKWFEASFVKDDGTYDVYSSTLNVPMVRTYDVSFRFSMDILDPQTQIPTYLKGQAYIYADTDESDLAYDVAKAAKLVAAKAPLGYCQTDQDCTLEAYARTCSVDPVNDANSKCVECLTDANCTGNPNALGPHCDTTELLCYCSADGECAQNPNGALCLTPKYCGCQGDENCDGGKTCVETPAGLYVCQ